MFLTQKAISVIHLFAESRASSFVLSPYNYLYAVWSSTKGHRISILQSMVVKTDFPQNHHLFPQKQDFPANSQICGKGPFIRIQFRRNRPRYPGRPCAFFGDPNIVTDPDNPTMLYLFKRRLFSRRPCTGPHPWAGRSQDCSDSIQ